MKVYQAINKVTDDLSKIGIGKDSKNEVQKYMFRGIDQIYNALSPLLAKHGLCILPRVLSRTVDERINKSGTVLFYVSVDVEFDFVSSEDGSRHIVKTWGEAMDSGDKATNKAMSAAYKYACIQSFAIPTEGDNDADNSTHELQNKLDADLAAIKGAENEEQLKKIYTLAIAAHKSNRANMEAIIKAKDIRKGELGRGGSGSIPVEPVSGNDVPAGDA